MQTKGSLARMRRSWERVGDAVLVLVIVVLSLSLYLHTLAPSVSTLFDDSLEFPLVVHRLAIAHPTGYPLYILLGRLFTLIPWRDVAGRVNLLSAVAAVLTVALVYAIIRQLARRRWPAFVGAAALAVSPVFWSQAVVAEVYSLNSMFIAGLLLLALRWARQPFLPIEPFSLLLSEGRTREPARDSSSSGVGGEVGESTGQPPGPEAASTETTPGSQTRISDSACRLAWRAGTFLRSGVREVAGRVASDYRRCCPAVPPKARLRLHPKVYALAGVFGLSLTHHRTAVLLAPAILVFAVLVEPRILSRAALLGPEHVGRPRWLRRMSRPAVLLVGSCLLPLLFYLYLPIRGHLGSLDGTYVNTWSGFWRWVSANSYGAFLQENPLARQVSATFYASLFWQQFGPVGLVLAAAGLCSLTRQAKALVLTGLAFLTYTAFALLYRAPDVEVFFIPAFVVVAIWIGVGLDSCAGLLRPRGRSLAIRRVLAVCLAMLVLASAAQPLVIAMSTYPSVDRSQLWDVHDYGRYVLTRPFPDKSTIVGLLGEMTLLRYFQETEGLGLQVETVVADDPAARLATVTSALDERRSVYLTRSLAGLTEEYSASAIIGPMEVDGNAEALVRVSDPQQAVPSAPVRADLEPAPGLQLLGYEVSSHEAHWQSWVHLGLWWRAPLGIDEPLKISARLLDSSGRLVAGTDGEPVAWTYPSTSWRAGEVVTDAYEILLPAGAPPGEYAPLVVVYDPVTGAERGRAALEPTHLEGSPARPPLRVLRQSIAHLVAARFGDVELLGYTGVGPEAPAHSGKELSLTLLWQARGRPPRDLEMTLWLAGGDGQLLFSGAVGGQFAVSEWGDGQVVRQSLSIQLPSALEPGRYRLELRVTRQGQPVPWSRWLLPRGTDLDLGPVEADG